MKGTEIILGTLEGIEVAALMVDGRIEDLLLAEADSAVAPGAILRARVGRLLKGQGGAFVTLPDGRQGYLRDRKGVGEGQSLVVQVSGSAEPGKAVPVTTRILLRGRYAIATPGAAGTNVSRAIQDEDRRAALEALGQSLMLEDGIGAILRSAAEFADDAAIHEELAELLDLARNIEADRNGPPELLLEAPSPAETAWRDWPEPDSLIEGDKALDESGARDAIEALLHPEIPLEGGGTAMIEPTRALVAIDVNTGRDHSPAAGLKANIALARDLPRQLRLRGLGGQVVIDFAPCPKRDRGTVEQVLRAAFKRDAAQAVLNGWTVMGLYELSRKRDRMALQDRLRGE